MAVKLRLARGGAKKRPFYRIVAADIRAPRDGKFIEKLGTFNPLLAKDHEQRLTVNRERVEYWLGTGAKATERVQRLLWEQGILKDRPAFIKDKPADAAPKLSKKQQARLEAGEAAKAEESGKEEEEASEA